MINYCFPFVSLHEYSHVNILTLVFKPQKFGKFFRSELKNRLLKVVQILWLHKKWLPNLDEWQESGSESGFGFSFSFS